jgi:hypothetical protein
MATLDGVYTRVEAPAVVPHPYGLFSVATPASPGDHAMVGFQWESWACINPNTITDPCINGGAAPGPKEFEKCPNTNSYKPITVYLGIKRTGQSLDVGQTQVQRVFEDAEETAVERHLWDLLNIDVTEAAAMSPAGALSVVEEQLGDGYMGTGVIHMSRGTAVRLGPELVRNGSRIETIIGTPVVVGAGYVAGGPTIYGTGALAVVRGDLEVVSAWNMSINDELILAERTYVVGWDCFATGVKVAAAT